MQGFTLTELLVALAITVSIGAIATQILISQLLQSRRLEAGQRLRENFSRLNYLIQVEASEADEIEIGAAAPPGCAGDGGFTLWIPKTEGIYATSENRSGIQYFQDDNGIWRCGPRVERNGRLVHSSDNDGSTHETGIVVPNASFVLNCAANTVVGRDVSYRIDFAGGNFGAAGLDRCVVAHAKSIYVCNPPLDTTRPCAERIGDCDCL